jgi:glycosyltransferase involved in cell wall biosynthesis
MAVVRPFGPNLAEMAMYRQVLAEFDVTYFYTGPTLEVVRREFDALGLSGLRVRRYRSYNDLLPFSTLQRALDFKVGVGSCMLTCLAEVCQHDVINIVDPIYMFASQIVRRLTSRQKLVVVRWEVIPNRYDDIVLARARAQKVLPRADAIVCTSLAARDSFKQRAPSNAKAQKITVIYPGIVLPTSAVDTSDRPPASIVTVARLQWQKGLDDLIAAVAILRRCHATEVRLSVIGRGDAKPWRALAESHGVGGTVDFLGSLPNVDVRRELSRAAVYCQASAVSRTWCEQFGFAVVEAMALGRPIVASYSGVLPEIVGEDGVFCAVRNASSLASALAQVLLDRPGARARGERLAARAREQYDADRQGHALLELVNGL